MGKAGKKRPWYEDPSAQAWLRRVERDLAPKIGDSAITVAIYNGKVDPKMAVELGYMVMLDKPILALVTPGMQVPAKLAAVVDRWVEGDPGDDAVKESIVATMKEMIAEVEARGGVSAALDPRWSRLLMAAREWRDGLIPGTSTGSKSVSNALIDAVVAFDLTEEDDGGGGELGRGGVE